MMCETFNKDMLERYEYCYSHICNSKCKHYYNDFLSTNSLGPTPCLCHYITTHYDIINIKTFELMSEKDLNEFFLYNCTNREWFVCEGSCMVCKINMLLNNENILIKGREK